MPGIRRTNSRGAPLDEEAEVLRAYIRDNVDPFMESFIRIPDKRGVIVPFRYQYGQRLIAKRQAEAERAGRPFRVYILKSRQVGLTTWMVNRNFTKCLANNYRRCVTVAHLEDRAKEILGKIKITYNKLPANLQFELAQDSKYEFGFADFGSKMFVVSGATLKSMELARGDTVQDVHASELTRWGDPEKGLIELQHVCHKLEGSNIGIETTGKNYGSYPHNLWNASKKGQTMYDAIFLNWKDDPETDLGSERCRKWMLFNYGEEYFEIAGIRPNDPRLQVWTDYERDKRMQEVWEYEPQLIERGKLYNLTPGNIWWSYQCLRDTCNGNWDLFLEDYPCSEDEAWQTRGHLYFSPYVLNALSHQIENVPHVIFEIKMEHLESGFKSFAQLNENPKIDTDDDEIPHLIVWAPPMDGRHYVIAGDSSAGNVGSDPSSIFVIDMITGEMMCEFHGVIKPHQTGILMDSLGRIYNIAMSAPEVNNQCGMSTLQQIQRLFYPKVYQERKLDNIKERLSNKAGWYTGPVTRPMALALLSRVLEAAAANPGMAGAIRSKGFLNECRTFIDNPNTGKPEAMGSCHDDRVITLAIAWMVAQIETKGWKDDILGMLRPTELTENNSGLILAKNMTVDEALAQVKQQLRVGEYSYGQQGQFWGNQG